ncbi:MAG: deoxyribodipyrimidine photolyase [Chlamydiales bacterium]|jgi:deoxyribodipyrimidine photo-lyase|nr:deoxyribodipyrimidine photolyase [Chlamydiales bacterium]
MIVVWHSRDLRLRDNPALLAALESGGPIAPLYLDDPESEGRWPAGSASRFWLHHSLYALSKAYEAKGGRLFFQQGAAIPFFQKLIAKASLKKVFFNERFEPERRAYDWKVAAFLRAQGVEVVCCNGNYLFDPSDVLNLSKKPYQVFTPFYRSALKIETAPPIQALPPFSFQREIPSLSLDALALLPKIHWSQEMDLFWQPGEEGAERLLHSFLKEKSERYETGRDLPGQDFSSRLSPHLHFGEISPRQILHALSSLPGNEAFIRQVYWREFGNSFLHHFPQATDAPWKSAFERFPWQENRAYLQAWQKGLTGYPIVDAAMRQLWRLGWMHNRARLIASSFLVKDLLQPWQLGARWFWDTLVDADLAQNTLGWQWIAGSGPDAAPYFRIFNPVLQGEKWDAEGCYIRSFVKELAGLPNCWIHKPWAAPKEVLAKAGVVLGRDYPHPIVDHAEAKEKALTAFRSLR